LVQQSRESSSNNADHSTPPPPPSSSLPPRCSESGGGVGGGGTGLASQYMKKSGDKIASWLKRKRIRVYVDFISSPVVVINVICPLFECNIIVICEIEF
jgi:hypothetical protein